MPEFLTHKYAKLPAWAWLAIFAGSAFVYFRVRSGGGTAGAGATSSDQQSGDAQLAGAEGQAQGYVQGYNSGYEQGTVVGTPPTTVPAGSGDCKDRRDPAGKTHHVCGNGFWIKAPGGTYRWVQGSKPANPIQIVRRGKNAPQPSKHPVSQPHNRAA